MKKIKLIQGKRYNFDGTLYLVGKVYSVKDKTAKELLDKENPANGLPYFVESTRDMDEETRQSKIDALEAKSNAEAESKEDSEADEKVEV